MYAAVQVYREIEWRLTPELIRSAFAKINKIIFDSKANTDSKLEQISKISALTVERIDLSFAPALDLKLASVVYFDETENPFSYDYIYAKNKIEHWVKSGDIPSFFLTLPNEKLIPGGAELKRISQSFFDTLKMESTLNLLIWNEVLDQNWQPNTTNDSEKILALQKELDLALKNLAANPPINTT